MSFKANEIASVLTAEIENYRSQIDTREVGKVLEVGDGIARVYGLGGVMAGEMVEFPRTGVFGLAFNLEESSVGIIILGNYLSIREGDEVRTTGQLLSVPVGEGMVGRVVDPLGNPLDGKGPIITSDRRFVESPAPGVADRQPVKTPLQTGIKAIDAMTPVGRGQRELIIGDRKTGKTAIAIDTIINQREEGVICVYVAVGQMEAKVAGTVEALRKYGAMDYTIVVVASSSDPAPLQYIAPYAGTAMAEYFMYQGKDTLCVYDDLSKQAAAYRQLSLLMRRPPGREAYPGDVFYCHSRLLERSARMAEKWVIVPSDADAKSVTAEWGVNSSADSSKPRAASETGKVYVGPLDKEHAEKVDLPKFPGHKLAKIPTSGGSLTALPIIETLEGEVSAYIPTNVISITDGQIYLVPDLFYKGVRPAVDVGVSVSRVGGNAQTGAMKKVAGGLKLDLAAFRDLEAFAQLGTELDKATQRQLDRGYRMIEVLKQPQFEPQPVVDQIMIIYAGTRGYLDNVPVPQVRSWEKQFLQFMKDQMPEVRNALKEKKALTPEIEEQLKKAITTFQPQFKA
ncbi:F0F1 ATP synthase subunit alpha [Tuwongella immobilis]|uniref:ATP synthase subunit alpha n=1 Tax=Tuwongella immobilis TaxID=692036 RepID=A0A6C2YPA9_9BACT|nr:F0F1 ATP synthase subunit alpha [Tuwongella immobilis]VIP03468.1 atp synthase subunit alpha : ATP synthase subunit alpha OS=Singulisphaera acidiphila (strain ATCC BAA-1392 / DSM 18658 / VKM B-2454 / MOB10) GN=atpA PE=3 SV=1: ATP-synt_ab_N: ATP-synt_ab: ATP-synt_ab_C [Tuwongella immobilis]VTS04308.1 atp synthase subunit alpha : ATP synthase subunit alpha OS=Singulisphaera acidiphila (strain ATCC BAA-1392 / DSM 18658 / VKM B-2454 / MOB10) GN=atpA PE=3 SV=1: ATP-synt_ab_N: ATP-synt_ab: ATP-synt_a